MFPLHIDFINVCHRIDPLIPTNRIIDLLLFMVHMLYPRTVVIVNNSNVQLLGETYCNKV